MLNLDFTLVKYEELCETISDSTYSSMTFAQYFDQEKSAEKYILIRHDIEKNPINALKMAIIENKYGIVSTYYCRKTERVFKPEYFHKIAALGHEIGYHYETLDKTKGDVIEAIQLFEKELSAFREFIDVKTACMHGNPFSAWSNKDIWDNHDFRKFGIIGEPYLSVDYNNVVYFTDTGRTWANKNIRVKDVVRNENHLINSSSKMSISSTDDIIDMINKECVPHICILVHPDRWWDNLRGWTKELVLQNFKNLGKAGIVWYRNRKSKII